MSGCPYSDLVDKHCCSYMFNVNDPLVINYNDSRQQDGQKVCLSVAVIVHFIFLFVRYGRERIN